MDGDMLVMGVSNKATLSPHWPALALVCSSATVHTRRFLFSTHAAKARMTCCSKWLSRPTWPRLRLVHSPQKSVLCCAATHALAACVLEVCTLVEDARLCAPKILMIVGCPALRCKVFQEEDK